jgi:hypothetical protein
MRTFGSLALGRKMKATPCGQVAAAILVVSLLALLNACATLPKDYPRSASYYFEPSTDSALQLVSIACSRSKISYSDATETTWIRRQSGRHDPLPIRSSQPEKELVTLNPLWYTPYISHAHRVI